MKQWDKLVIVAGIIAGFSSVQAQQDYQKWLQSQQSEFENFKDAHDKEFLEFLKKNWADFQVSKGIIPDSTPKPNSIPKAEPRAVEETAPSNQTIVKPQPIPESPEQPQIELRPSPVKIKNAKKSDFQFFGNSLSVEYDTQMQIPVNTPVSADKINDFWSAVAQSDYEPLYEQFQRLHQDLGLNDWGYAQLIYNAGQSIENGDKNAAQLLAWFMLLKSGYKVKVGFDDNQVYLMFPSKNDVYDVSYLPLGNEKYYVIPLDGQRVKLAAVTTYEGDYPEADQDVNFQLGAPPRFQEHAITKTVKFKYVGEEHVLTYRINQNAVDFLNTYPQTDLMIYPAAGLTSDVASDLLKQLQQIVDGEPETRAVNILLRFVQTGFEYQTDDEQFGHENYLFPEESLYYPASDCEDRSALFAYLVNSLLGLDVVLLDYPGHIATAVKFSSDVNGDSIEYDGDKYIICDPTYIYAEYGMTMPSVKDQEYKVIPIPKG